MFEEEKAHPNERLEVTKVASNELTINPVPSSLDLRCSIMPSILYETSTKMKQDKSLKILYFLV